MSAYRRRGEAVATRSTRGAIKCVFQNANFFRYGERKRRNYGRRGHFPICHFVNNFRVPRASHRRRRRTNGRRHYRQNRKGGIRSRRNGRRRRSDNDCKHFVVRHRFNNFYRELPRCRPVKVFPTCPYSILPHALRRRGVTAVRALASRFAWCVFLLAASTRCVCVGFVARPYFLRHPIRGVKEKRRRSFNSSSIVGIGKLINFKNFFDNVPIRRFRWGIFDGAVCIQRLSHGMGRITRPGNHVKQYRFLNGNFRRSVLKEICAPCFGSVRAVLTTCVRICSNFSCRAKIVSDPRARRVTKGSMLLCRLIR